MSIFPRADESLNLLIPLVFLSLALFSLALSAELSRDQYIWIFFAAGFIGLNIIHNVFTITLFYLPELRIWTQEQSRARERNVVLGWALVLFLIAAFVQAQFYFMNWDDPAADFRKWEFSAIRGAQWAFTMWHALSQYYGLSILYNQRGLPEQPPPAIDAFRSAEALERRLFRAFVALGALGLGLRVGFFWLPQWVFWGAALLLFSLALAIHWVVRRYPGIGVSNKPYYLLRIFLVPLAMISPIALLALAFVHGTEYWFVYKKMVARSQVSAEGRKKLFWITAGASLLVGAIALPRPEGGLPYATQVFSMMPQLWIQVLVGISTTLTLFHCYMDGVLFHFSDPVTRKNISPLLK